MLIGDHALVTGQIPRTTPFEKGSPNQVALIDGQWQPDPWIHDDQAIVMNVKDKGLVVLTGCGHAGVVNTLKCARRVDRRQSRFMPSSADFISPARSSSRSSSRRFRRSRNSIRV